jgi:hypothetical protein
MEETVGLASGILQLDKSEKRYWHTVHAQSFDVACTCDRFSLFSLQELGKPL